MNKALNLFAKRLGIFLAEKGWGQGDLAEASGIKRPQLSLYMNRKVPPNLETIEKIATALGKPISDFFKEEVTLSSKGHIPGDLKGLWEAAHPSDREIVLNLLRKTHIKKKKSASDETE